MKVREKVREAAHSVRNGPRWFVLRLATATGVSAGWWIMAICAAVVGAVAAVLVVSVVHVTLKDWDIEEVASTVIDGGSFDWEGVKSTDGD